MHTVWYHNRRKPVSKSTCMEVVEETCSRTDINAFSIAGTLSSFHVTFHVYFAGSGRLGVWARFVGSLCVFAVFSQNQE